MMPQKKDSDDRAPFLLELGKIVNKLVHDVRNPISAIKGYTSLMQKDLQNQPHLREMAGKVLQATDNLEELINRVLEYSRPLAPAMAKLDFVRLVKQVEKEFLEHKPLQEEWELRVPSDPLVFAFDMLLMKQALLLLLQNAREALPEGGKISLSIERRGDEVWIQVCDSGQGIDPDLIEQIWAPFFTTKKNGKGFGLPTAKKMIESHSGEIVLQSARGKGTIITIRIPIHD